MSNTEGEKLALLTLRDCHKKSGVKTFCQKCLTCFYLQLPPPFSLILWITLPFWCPFLSPLSHFSSSCDLVFGKGENHALQNILQRFSFQNYILFYFFNIPTPLSLRMRALSWLRLLPLVSYTLTIRNITLWIVFFPSDEFQSLSSTIKTTVTLHQLEILFSPKDSVL